MNAVDKVGYSHDKIIDALIAEPRVTQRQLAGLFGYTEGWLSRVMSSDSFKMRVAARRAEIIDPQIVASVEDRFKMLAVRGLEVLQEKLDEPASLISENLALKAVEIGAKGLAVGGFGAKVQVDINNNIDLRGAIEEAHTRRQTLRLGALGVATAVIVENGE